MESTSTERTGDKSRAVHKASAALIPPTAPGTAGDRLRVMAKGKGTVLTDVDGNEYVDYFCSRGASILGHADERIVVAVNKAVSKGCHLSPTTEPKVRLAELIASRFAPIDQVEFARTDSEAAQFAVRLARFCTGREAVVTFDGCPAAHRCLDCPVESLISVPYNDTGAVEAAFGKRGPTIAAVLVEPVATSFGLATPADGFLETLQRLCREHDALLAFDEMTSGFRLGAGGAAARYSVTPDMILLGPIIGGGLSLAACGGRKDVMKQAARMAAEDRPGPLVGFEPALAAGVAVLQAVGEADFFAMLESLANRLHEGLCEATATAGIAAHHVQVGGLVGLNFTDREVTDLATAQSCDEDAFDRYVAAMFARGISLAPSPYIPLFVSTAHTEAQIGQTIEAARDSLRVVSGEADA
jgi:glutamate-1-semialdehyde 2,1-aminomutase